MGSWLTITPPVMKAPPSPREWVGMGNSVTSIAYLGYLLSPPVLGQVPGTLGWNALWGVTALAALTVIALTLAVARR